jgi:hypothetical protein
VTNPNTPYNGPSLSAPSAIPDASQIAPATSASPAPAVPATPVSAPPPAPQSTADKILAQTDPSSPILGALAAGGYNAANTALLGLPNLALKTFSPQTYQYTQGVTAAHPYASVVGDLAGAIAPMFVGDGLGAAGVAARAGSMAAKAVGMGKIAEGIDGVITAAKGGEGISKVVQGLAQGALQSVPQAVTQGLTTGDWGDAAKMAAIGTAAGGVLGGAVGGVAGNAADAADTAGDTLAKLKLSSLGINTGMVRKSEMAAADLAGANKVGYALNHTNDLINGAADRTIQEGINTKPQLIKYVDGLSAKYQPIDDAWQAATQAQPDLLTSQVPNFIQDPAFQAVATKANLTPEQTNGILTNLTSVSDRTGTLPGIRSYLQEQGTRLGNSEDNANYATGQFAKLLDNKVQDMATNIAQQANPSANFQELLKQYPVDMLLKRASVAEQQRIEPAIQAGSNTFQKFMTQNAISGLVGGGVGSQEGNNGFNLPGAVGGFIAGSTLGPVANKLISGAGNSATGKIAGFLSKSPLAENIGRALTNNASAITSGAARSAAAVTPTVMNALQGQPSAQTPSANIPATGTTIATPPSAYQSPNTSQTRDLLGNDITTPAYTQAVQDGLARIWYRETGASPQAGPPTKDNPLFVRFTNGLLDAVKTNGQVDPTKIGPLLFNSKSQGENYVNYAKAKLQAQSAAQSAPASTGFIGSNISGTSLTNNAAFNSKQQLINSLESIAGKPAAAEFNTYMARTGASSADILNKFEEIARKYNPQLAQSLKSLGQ